MRRLWERLVAFRRWWAGLSPVPSTLVMVGVVVAGLLVLVGLAAGWGALRGESRAAGACEEAVEARLKSPASAEFLDDPMVTKSGDVWEVRGGVDAQNGFGAMIRNFYTCKVEHGDLGWYAYDVEFEGAG